MNTITMFEENSVSTSTAILSEAQPSIVGHRCGFARLESGQANYRIVLDADF
jgi:hypothetical protein